MRWRRINIKISFEWIEFYKSSNLLNSFGIYLALRFVRGSLTPLAFSPVVSEVIVDAPAFVTYQSLPSSACDAPTLAILESSLDTNAFFQQSVEVFFSSTLQTTVLWLVFVKVLFTNTSTCLLISSLVLFAWHTDSFKSRIAGLTFASVASIQSYLNLVLTALILV